MASEADALDIFYIDQEEVKCLITYFSRCCYRTNHADDYAKGVMQKCIELAKLDYNVSVLDNSSGDLCAHYPSHLILMESENNPSGELIKNTIYEGIEPQRLRELITKARSARCRTRFPMPVIFYQGKYICRSATLSGGPEIYGRSGFDYFFAGDQSENNDDDDNEQPNNCNNWILCDQVRKEDIKLLRALNVGTIVDFMVEKKKVKFGLNVTSSEKVDKENRYSQFTILSLPYPGCEFFREFRDQNYSAENLYYNWGQTHVDAEIIVPQDNITERVQVKWKDYKKWNLPSLTENYLKLLLGYVFDSSSGVLVHCISGWDRTPLFISLLRICLWADGAIHKSLTPIQMLYFTIAYDWLLFGHDLQDRKNKGEDIFYFCFHFLKFVMGDEFSSQKCRSKMPSGGEMQCEGPELEGGELIMYSQGSNHSLNSSWSSISSKSQDINPSCQTDDLINMPGGIWIGEGGGSLSQQSSSSSSTSTVIETGDRLKMSHTSPVSVPSKTNARQRNESTSSLNVGSAELENPEIKDPPPECLLELLSLNSLEECLKEPEVSGLKENPELEIKSSKDELKPRFSEEPSESTYVKSQPVSDEGENSECKNIGDELIEEIVSNLEISSKYAGSPVNKRSETLTEDQKEASPLEECGNERFVEPKIVTAVPVIEPTTTFLEPELGSMLKPAKEESDSMFLKHKFQEFELATEATDISSVELISEQAEFVIPKSGTEILELELVTEPTELPSPKVINELSEFLEIEFAIEATEFWQPQSDMDEVEVAELPVSGITHELHVAETTSELPAAEIESTEFQEQQEALNTRNNKRRSWQYVSSTGSLRSTASGSTVSSNSRSSGERQGETAITDSVATLTDSPDSCFISQRKHSGDHSQCGSSCAMRRERLDQIRKLFSICYCQSIGHNLKDGSEGSGISNIFGNIAGKIMKS